MNSIKCDLWELYDDGQIVCITTNGMVKKDGTNVMGRGCAKQCADRFPWFPAALGSHLQDTGNDVGIFGRIITFPVKHNWYESADLALIEHSGRSLAILAGTLFQLRQIYLPRPGCGNGKLRWDAVEKVLDGVLGRSPNVIIVDYP